MSDSPPRDPALKALSGELRHVQNQLTVLHQQGAVMLRLLSAMMNRLNELGATEEGLERGLESIEKEIAQLITPAPDAATCPVCGGPLDHHRAASGELRICTACGFSQFVDGHGVVRSATTPASLPVAGDDLAPPSWVG